MCADVATGFRNLYLGDLTGWRTDEDQKEHWQPRDWKLHFDGKTSQRI